MNKQKISCKGQELVVNQSASELHMGWHKILNLRQANGVSTICLLDRLQENGVLITFLRKKNNLEQVENIEQMVGSVGAFDQSMCLKMAHGNNIKS